MIVKWFTIITSRKLFTFFMFHGKQTSPKKFCQICASSTFSRLNLTYLIIKSQKRKIPICQMIHDYHHKLSSFSQPLTSFLYDERSISLSKFSQNCVCSTFSCLHLTCLVIKSQKQRIHICEMVHN